MANPLLPPIPISIPVIVSDGKHVLSVLTSSLTVVLCPSQISPGGGKAGGCAPTQPQQFAPKVVVRAKTVLVQGWVVA